LNQFRTESRILNQDDKRVIHMLESTVSKAAAKIDK